jgi:predicted DNA-binding WGR domain protein
MPRFENHIPPHNKYWIVDLVGNMVITQWGRIGNSSQRNEKLCPNSYAARREYDSLIASKEAKGYQLVTIDRDNIAEARELLIRSIRETGPSGKMETRNQDERHPLASKLIEKREKARVEAEAEYRRKMLMDNPLV